jgi:hypothetical protein
LPAHADFTYKQKQINAKIINYSFDFHPNTAYEYQWIKRTKQMKKLFKNILITMHSNSCVKGRWQRKMRWVRKMELVGYKSGTVAIGGYLPYEHAAFV